LHSHYNINMYGYDNCRNKRQDGIRFSTIMENINMINVIKDNNKPASVDKKLSERFAECLSSERNEPFYVRK
jgi:hypothetical protein